MKAYIGVTDNDWFTQLSRQSQLEEVNFWQPGGNQIFKVLRPGELFLFKLHHPYNFIVGGGIFAHSTLLPISLAWESFQEANGTKNLHEMRTRVSKYRRQPDDRITDYRIGCIILEQPFLLDRDDWIPVPSDFSPYTQQGKSYDLTIEPGYTLWKRLQFSRLNHSLINDERERYGNPVTIVPRLGQGSFRIMVTDAYERKCAVTNERTLPALDAAHIKPYSESGAHEVSNGVLLRKYLHALFDRGYITISPSMNLEVSHRIREEFENGRDYYRLHGSQIRLPDNPQDHPSREYLEWHNNSKYPG